MYESFISWLEDVSTELDQEKEINRLTNRKRDLRCEICHLEFESHRFYTLYSQANLALSKARYAYELNEYKLACADGRLTIFEEFDAEKQKDDNIKSMLNSMNSVDRQRLLAELEGMEE
jgi:hypothetical protein